MVSRSDSDAKLFRRLFILLDTDFPSRAISAVDELFRSEVSVSEVHAKWLETLLAHPEMQAMLCVAE